MNKYFNYFFTKVNNRVLRMMDGFIDNRVCGQKLVEYIPSVYRDDAHGVGMTGSQSTRYLILDRIFSHISLTEQDVFLDIGCGMGRVLAFLLKKHAPCPLYGIEINPVSGKVAQEWSSRFDQVTVTLGDAFQLDYNHYTVLFMGRPFLPKTFLEFIEKLEASLTHPVRIIYWVDQQSGHLLKDRPGWEMQFREKVFKIHGLRVVPSPQYYSIWVYDPEKRKK